MTSFSGFGAGMRLAAGMAVVVAASLTACSSGGDAAGSNESIAATGDSGAQATVVSSQAVSDSEARLDQIVAQIQQDTGVPGIAVGVVYEGQPVIAKGYGVTQAGTDTPVSPETVFQLASVSKPLGATAVAGAVGRGDLEWNQPVISELPDFQLSVPYVTENATVADFYSHRTGLPGESAGNDLETIGFDQEQILSRLRYLPLAPFRATYSYSNFGLTVGAAAAAAAYGAPFEQMAEEVLFEPAGMTSTSFSHDDFLQQEDTASLHVLSDGAFVTGFQRDADAQAPAGGASSNVADMNRWLILTLGQGQLDGQQIIDAEALAETKRAHINTRPDADPELPPAEYGLGWNVGQAQVDPALLQWSHSGAFSQGAATTVRVLPELGLGVVVLTNAQPIGAAEAIADTYLDTLIHGEATEDWAARWGEVVAGLLEPPPVDRPAEPTPPRADTAYVGTYANDYVGDVVVRSGADGQLEMAMGPGGVTVRTLQPLDGNRFTFVEFPEISGALSVVAFEFAGDSAVASSLIIEESPIFGDSSAATPWTVLTRQG